MHYTEESEQRSFLVFSVIRINTMKALLNKLADVERLLKNWIYVVLSKILALKRT